MPGLVGGKAASLSLMIRNLKVSVPGGYAIISDAFENGSVKEEALAELNSLVSHLPQNVTYAVRSSAIGEDGLNRSYAGQYETLTDVKPEEIVDAVKYVISSSDSERVEEYKNSFSEEKSGIGVVIQTFVKPEFAGVVFTSDIITGKDDFLVGNYVHGEGEQLVSGASNAEVFRIGVKKYSYEGNREFAKYAKTLGRYCMDIRKFYGVPMDIEWAVSNGKVYILQSRPITTLRRHIKENFDYNGTRSGYKLLTKTNVGEIFMNPVSPMTMSVLDRINEFLGLPEWLDCVSGQAYMNVSVICSLLMSFGKSKKKAYESVRDLVGGIPEGVEIPVTFFDKRKFKKNLWKLLFPKEKSKLSKKEKKQMVADLAAISKDCMEDIRKIQSNEELIRYWDEVILKKLYDGLAAILSECGTAMIPLFGTRKKIAKVAGDDMANRLCGGCVGIIDSMKPMLLLEDVAAGTLSKEEYVSICGHRCVNEMELMSPRPYEDPSFPDNLLEERKASPINLHQMKEHQEKEYEEALAEFKKKYPSKSHWIDRKIAKFVHANAFREDMRSKGVWIFSVFREFILKAGELNNLGDNVFMLGYDEMFKMLRGDKSALKYIKERKETVKKNNSYPPFPSLIIGRFNPDAWMAMENRRNDFYCADMQCETASDSDIKGFPGAAGKVTGKVRVISDINHIDEVEEGDILVTCATNIGWTLVFPKVSAIVTDIGAPLSHAAIVAREFGIPAVVGCCNATTVLKTGDVVTVDGAKGIVIIEK
jgi:pyruvate,water dikinase